MVADLLDVFHDIQPLRLDRLEKIAELLWKAQIFQSLVRFWGSLGVSCSSFAVWNDEAVRKLGELSWVLVVDCSYASINWDHSNEGFTEDISSIGAKIEEVRRHVGFSAGISSCSGSHQDMIVVMGQDGPVAVNDGQFERALVLNDSFDFWSFFHDESSWNTSGWDVDAVKRVILWAFVLVRSFVTKSEVDFVGGNKLTVLKLNSTSEGGSVGVLVNVNFFESLVFLPNSSKALSLLLF